MMRKNIFYKYGIKTNHLILLFAGLQLVSMYFSKYIAHLDSFTSVSDCLPVKNIFLKVASAAVVIRFYSLLMTSEISIAPIVKLHAMYIATVGIRHRELLVNLSTISILFEFCFMFFSISTILSKILTSDVIKDENVRSYIANNSSKKYLIMFIFFSGLSQFRIFKLLIVLLGIASTSSSIAFLRDYSKKEPNISIYNSAQIILISLFTNNIILFNCFVTLYSF